MATLLGYSWYRFDLPEPLVEWLTLCLREQISSYQPFDHVCVKAKHHQSGKKEFKLVFSYKWTTLRNGQLHQLNFPVCYLLDVNRQKFKGNAMNYQIGEGLLYSNVYPVFNQHIVFKPDSLFVREKAKLTKFLQHLDVPKAPTQTWIDQPRRSMGKRKRRSPGARRLVNKPSCKVEPALRRGRASRGSASCA